MEGNSVGTSYGITSFMLFRLILLEVVLLALLSCSVGSLVALGLNSWFATVGIKLEIPVDMGGILFDSIKGEISMKTVFLPGFFVVLAAYPDFHRDLNLFLSVIDWRCRGHLDLVQRFKKPKTKQG